MGFAPRAGFDQFPRQPQQIATAADVQRMFDGYDLAVRYADDHVGQILGELEDLGIAGETAVIVSSDHGETLGELGIYCDHQTADLHTHRVPGVVRWPGLTGGRTDAALRYQVDLAATVVDLLGGTVPEVWDGKSFAADLPDRAATAADNRRDHLILSCAAWATQRAIRFEQWLCIRTYHDAFHGFPPIMLFDVDNDPHEQVDLADKQPDIVDRAARLLLDWEATRMERSPSGVDPLWTVMFEGGGYYTRGQLEPYLRRLNETGRRQWADRLQAERRGARCHAPT
jgi:arylsulfatase A-like enzyme